MINKHMGKCSTINNNFLKKQEIMDIFKKSDQGRTSFKSMKCSIDTS